MDKSRWILAGLLTLVLAVPVQAQDDEALVQVITFTVKPGMNAQFEEVVDKYREASSALGMNNYWLSAQSVSGDPVYRFHMQRSGWGDLSNPGPDLVAHYGEAEAARLMGLVADSVASEHVAFYREQASMSHTPAEGFEVPPEGLIYIDFTLNPGTAPQFTEMVRHQQVASSTLYPDSYFGYSAPDFGASGPRTVLILETFGDLANDNLGAGQRLIEHYGEEEGARLIGLAQASIASTQAQLFRTRPDLNYQPN